MKTLDEILKELEPYFDTSNFETKDFLRTALLSVAEESSMAGVVEELEIPLQQFDYEGEVTAEMLEDRGRQMKIIGHNQARTEALGKREEYLKKLRG